MREFLSRLSGLQALLVPMRMQDGSLASFSGLRIQHCHELWHRPAATAPIQPLAWELPYAMGAALKSKKKKKSAFYRWGNWGPEGGSGLHKARSCWPQALNATFCCPALPRLPVSGTTQSKSLKQRGNLVMFWIKDNTSLEKKLSIREKGGGIGLLLLINW